MAVAVNRSLRLPVGEYFPEAQRKSRIRLGSTLGLLGAAGLGVVLGRAIP